MATERGSARRPAVLVLALLMAAAVPVLAASAPAGAAPQPTASGPAPAVSPGAPSSPSITVPAGPGSPAPAAGTTGGAPGGRSKLAAVLGAALLIGVLYAFSQGYGILGGRSKRRPRPSGTGGQTQSGL